MAYRARGTVPARPAVTYAGAGGPGVPRPKMSTLQVRDASGTNLVTNDPGGFGLARPTVGWNTYPTAQETTPPESTGSGSFVALRTVAGEPQHPRLRVRVRAVTGAATSGEVRLRDRTSGTVIAGPLAVGLATTVEANLDGTLITPALGAATKVDVEARITAGAATIAVLVVYATGIGS
jgi:hypothetical protein